MNTLLERVLDTIRENSVSIKSIKDSVRRRSFIASLIYNVPVEDMENGTLILYLFNAVKKSAFILNTYHDEEIDDMNCILKYVEELMKEG